MKSLLVATDLSDRSARALDRAFAIAERAGARLKLLHVTDADLPEEMATAQQHAAMQRLTGLAAARPEVDAHVEAAIDDPMTKIHTAADEAGAELIVLGVHRSRPLADMFSSTTMERLVRASAQPVLLVKDAVSGPYAHPLCGVDLSPACAAAARMAADLAPGAPIAAYYAFHAPFRGFRDSEAQMAPFQAEAKASLEEWMKGADLPETFQPPAPVAAGVRHALEMAMHRMAEAGGKTDLLVIGAHGRSVFSPNLLGSFTEELLRHPLCDTLVAKG
ncbi:MAG: universal stress protein [Pseudomonadota bacterium]